MGKRAEGTDPSETRALALIAAEIEAARSGTRKRNDEQHAAMSAREFEAMNRYYARQDQINAARGPFRPIKISEGEPSGAPMKRGTVYSQPSEILRADLYRFIESAGVDAARLAPECHGHVDHWAEWATRKPNRLHLVYFIRRHVARLCGAPSSDEFAFASTECEQAWRNDPW